VPTRKPKTVAKLKQEAATLLQKLVRMKYADDFGMCQCVTCNKVQHWKEMDGGHWISRSSAHLLTEENIHPQCKGCNRFMSGCHEQYTLFMIDTYGMDTVREMASTKRQVMKYARIDLEDMIADYKKRIKEQERRLAGV
jgi:hypothetical protein